MPLGADPEAAVAAPPLEPAQVAEPPPTPAQPSPRRRTLLALGGAALATAAAGGGIVWLRRPRIPAQARTLYQQGMDALNPGLPEDNQQAQGFLREAVAIAPDYADAWGALALAYQAAQMYTPPARQPQVKAAAADAAGRALKLDPRQPQATAALALMAPVWRNWAPAEALYLRALSLHGRDAEVEFVFARFLLSVGRLREAVTRAQASVAGDEFAVWHHHTLANSLWGAGRIAEADQAVEKALGRWPRHYALWFTRLAIFTYTGRADRAVAMGADLAGRPLNIPPADIELSLAAARAMLTRAPGDIRAAVDSNLEAAKRGAGYAENAMSLTAALGRLDDAFALAQALFVDEALVASGQRFSSGRYTAPGRRQTHHLFMPPTGPMRTDPRFPQLMQTIGLTAYWQASGRMPDDPSWAGRP